MSDNFNLRKYLVENKATTNSKMMNEGLTADQAINKLESMGFKEELLAYIVQDGKVQVINKQDRMLFDHYRDYLYDLVDTNGEIIIISKYQNTIPSVDGIEANLKAVITFNNGEKLIIAQDTTSKIPQFDDDGKIVGDLSNEDSMNLYDVSDSEYLSLKDKYLASFIPTEKWLKSKGMSEDEIETIGEMESFSEFEEALGEDFPLIYTFEIGGTYVDNEYVYDLGDNNVAIVDDYVDGFMIVSKADFEKFKQAVKQAGGKPTT